MRQKSQERNTENEATRKTILCLLTRTAALSSLGVLCCPSEEFKEIAYDCSLECSAEESDCKERKEVRDIRVMQITEVSYTLPQSFNFILRGLLLPGVCSSFVALLLICSIYFIYSDTGG